MFVLLPIPTLLFWALFLWLPSIGFAHPTNGHFCTEIDEPVRCFNSDGFCEWAFAQCLYRCDIHDSREDCEQIKEGCSWQTDTCVPDPIEMDSAVEASPSNLDLDMGHREDSAELDGHDSVTEELDATWSLDADTQNIARQRRTAQCTQAKLHPLYLLAAVIVLWRRKPCS